MTTPVREKRDTMVHGAGLDCAREAMAANEVPIGAIVVDEHGEIIARAANSMEQDCSQGSHAEIKALGHSGQSEGKLAAGRLY